MNKEVGMIGYAEMFGIMAAVCLPCAGALVAMRHQRSAWAGMALGTMAFVAVVSGWLVMLIVSDVLSRRKRPNQIGVDRSTAMASVFVFAASLAGSIWLLRWICIPR